MFISVLTFILAYITIGLLVSFFVKWYAYKFDWLEETREVISIYAWLFWPLFAVLFFPILAIIHLSSLMDKKARELSRK